MNLWASSVRMNVNKKCFLVSSWPNSVSAFSTFAWTCRKTLTDGQLQRLMARYIFFKKLVNFLHFKICQNKIPVYTVISKRTVTSNLPIKVTVPKKILKHLSYWCHSFTNLNGHSSQIQLVFREKQVKHAVTVNGGWNYLNWNRRAIVSVIKSHTCICKMYKINLRN